MNTYRTISDLSKSAPVAETLALAFCVISGLPWWLTLAIAAYVAVKWLILHFNWKQTIKK